MNTIAKTLDEVKSCTLVTVGIDSEEVLIIIIINSEYILSRFFKKMIPLLKMRKVIYLIYKINSIYILLLHTFKVKMVKMICFIKKLQNQNFRSLLLMC